MTTLDERFVLRLLVEACLVLEEGVATSEEDIDRAMTLGAGIVPPPFARARAVGLDETLAALERAEAEWGDAFAAPAVLREMAAAEAPTPAR
jgi:3-hydroxyacyl-CoA dehydrogenase